MTTNHRSNRRFSDLPGYSICMGKYCVWQVLFAEASLELGNPNSKRTSQIQYFPMQMQYIFIFPIQCAKLNRKTNALAIYQWYFMIFLVALAKTCPESLAPPYGVLHLSTSEHQFWTGFLHLTIFRKQTKWPHTLVVNKYN